MATIKAVAVEAVALEATASDAKETASDVGVKVDVPEIVNVTPLIVPEDRSRQVNQPRLVYSIVGSDGHAPLQDYSAPYVRGPEAPMYLGKITGWEYRVPQADGTWEPGNFALILAAARTERGVLSWVYVPCQPQEDGTWINTIFDGMIAQLKVFGLVYASWDSMEALEKDDSAEATEVKKAWPTEWTQDGVRTMLQIS